MHHRPGHGAGALTVVSFLYGYFVLPESLPAFGRKNMHWRSANPFTALRALVQLRGAWRRWWAWSHSAG